MITLALLISQSFNFNKTTENIKIKEGTGVFQIMGGMGHENDTINIHYYKPKNFNSNSKILMVIPGSGRNADSYRDSWITASEKHNVLIISPSYKEKNYSYEDYHLGGMVKDISRAGFSFVKNSNHVIMNEDLVRFSINLDSKLWIYNDFDRIFKIVKKAVNSNQTNYDMFGHSAGGQILHRFVLMHPKSKARTILASNAGSYTIPDLKTEFPFGIKGMNLNLKKSLKKDLVLFLGELDNANETGGLLLRSKTIDKQGLHRLSRGTNFYNKGIKISERLNLKCNWKIEIVPNIGHNQRLMAKAAAKYLYEHK
ncbi:hypothetical protein FUA24_18645 [Seonamhaeicola marinus]|uniref:Alpha/beta hydrolase n=1 Tax=Seonamhaeicola marinus TaxID=1912246 RepID=A0A5D0HKV5_9FLAO|nr:hypothetical protein FUA24_18645 [Seonamhaeicola marinus]